MAMQGCVGIDNFSDQVKEQLQIIRTSKVYILFSAVAIFLAYTSTSIQEKQLICSTMSQEEQLCCPAIGQICGNLPDTCPQRITSVLLTLWVLIYFYEIAGDTAAQPAADALTQRLNRLGYLASLLSLIAGLLRAYITLTLCRRQPTAIEIPSDILSISG